MEGEGKGIEREEKGKGEIKKGGCSHKTIG